MLRAFLSSAVIILSLWVSPANATLTFEEYFNNNPDVILLINPETGLIERANITASAFYGYAPEILEGMGIQDINQLSPEQVAEEIRLAKTQHRNYFVFRHKIANGEVKTVEVRSKPISFDGRTLLISTIRDISDKRALEDELWHYQNRLEEMVEVQTIKLNEQNKRIIYILIAVLFGTIVSLAIIIHHARKVKKAQIALEEANTRLTDIIWGTNAGTWEWNVQTGETIFNEKWANMLGYSLEELQPVSIETWMNFCHPDDLKKSEDILKRYFSKEIDFYESECRVKHRNGNWVWILDRGRVIEWTEDEQPYRMAGTHTDITEKVYAKQQETRAQQRLTNALKIAGAGNWIYDVRADLFTLDDNCFSLFKTDVETVGSYQMTSEEYANRFCHPDDVSVVRYEIDKAVSSEETKFNNQLEHKIQFPDGDLGYLAVRYYVVRDEEDNVSHLEGVLQNITDSKNVYIEINEAKKQAEKASRAKSEFLANMSHELRTPMMGIRGVLDLMRDDEIIHGRANTLLNDLDEASKSLMGLLDNVLDLSKIEAGKLVLEFGIWEPARIVQSLTNVFTTQTSQKGFEISTNAEQFLGYYCELDDLRFRQILSNLLNNAVKFTFEGEIIVNMNIIEGNDGDTILIEISDTGIGMSEETQRVVFDRFHQAEKGTARRYGGSGLGLSISKELTELFHGTLTVKSTLGEGTTFTLSIPTKKAEFVEAHEQAAKLPIMKILLAEDNAINQKVVSTMLSNRGHSIEIADNGLQAVSKASESKFDLILMDMHMPEMDGIEATKIIRQEKGLNAVTPIIAFTADAVAVHQNDFKDAGVDGIITKPIMFEKLSREIGRILKVS